MKIKFIQKNSGRDTKLYLGDNDITSCVSSFKFNASADAISTVVLEIFPSEVEIESEDFKLTTNDFTFADMLDAFTEEASKYIKNNAVIRLKDEEGDS